MSLLELSYSTFSLLQQSLQHLDLLYQQEVQEQEKAAAEAEAAAAAAAAAPPTRAKKGSAAKPSKLNAASDAEKAAAASAAAAARQQYENQLMAYAHLCQTAGTLGELHAELVCPLLRECLSELLLLLQRRALLLRRKLVAANGGCCFLSEGSATAALMLPVKLRCSNNGSSCKFLQKGSIQSVSPPQEGAHRFTAAVVGGDAEEVTQTPPHVLDDLPSATIQQADVKLQQHMEDQLQCKALDSPSFHSEDPNSPQTAALAASGSQESSVTARSQEQNGVEKFNYLAGLKPQEEMEKLNTAATRIAAFWKGAVVREQLQQQQQLLLQQLGLDHNINPREKQRQRELMLHVQKCQLSLQRQQQEAEAEIDQMRQEVYEELNGSYKDKLMEQMVEDGKEWMLNFRRIVGALPESLQDRSKEFRGLPEVPEGKILKLELPGKKATQKKGAAASLVAKARFPAAYTYATDSVAVNLGKGDSKKSNNGEKTGSKPDNPSSSGSSDSEKGFKEELQRLLLPLQAIAAQHPLYASFAGTPGISKHATDSSSLLAAPKAAANTASAGPSRWTELAAEEASRAAVGTALRAKLLPAVAAAAAAKADAVLEEQLQQLRFELDGIKPRKQRMARKGRVKSGSAKCCKCTAAILGPPENFFDDLVEVGLQYKLCRPALC
ncbi:uncharacterized protein LOC34619454 [Cyclospora cayetanensis]|uniref:Uncharacterized protein LOC34619454 n=1 Tax=Cyclospora cayetanensis TaxID=88456 RepID=A0A6P6RVL1_9EIME|nr:uncharacterized protein LOC34619454 [Cyclospora cayetanensis]